MQRWRPRCIVLISCFLLQFAFAQNCAWHALFLPSYILLSAVAPISSFYFIFLSLSLLQFIFFFLDTVYLNTMRADTPATVIHLDDAEPLPYFLGNESNLRHFHVFLSLSWFLLFSL